MDFANLRLLFSPPLQLCYFCSKILIVGKHLFLKKKHKNLSVSTGNLETEILHLSLSVFFSFSSFEARNDANTLAFLSCSNNYAECCSVIQHPS